MAFEVLDTIIYHMETYEPELIRSCIPNYFLAKKAREHVKVVITGEGSDELWSGYLYYQLVFYLVLHFHVCHNCYLCTS